MISLAFYNTKFDRSTVLGKKRKVGPKEVKYMTIWLYEQLSIKLIGSSFENQPWLLIDELIGKLCY